MEFFEKKIDMVDYTIPVHQSKFKNIIGWIAEQNHLFTFETIERQINRELQNFERLVCRSICSKMPNITIHYTKKEEQIYTVFVVSQSGDQAV
ncbi:hypothetical protein MT881_002513 [Enterococcus faecium]|nr:hypothetical protein [Enterococcus faecium]